jgi:CDP-glucose 4,6-dehydratase
MLMESIDLSIYRGKRVLLTGHTGFKGSWMTKWLEMLGAEVYGFSLPPEGPHSLFELLGNERQMNSEFGDLRDKDHIKRFVEKTQPDIIFHLAAQALVRESYKNPLFTWETNVMGTIHVLEAVRELGLRTNIVIVTSDKCYENKEWIFGYRENDPLGGYDPYSSSKGAAELIVSSWRNSYFNPEKYEEHGVMLSSARAGNVIGGGDWAKDRIIPDCIRHLTAGEPIKVRNPFSTRPWQHVLESLGGYLLLGRNLLLDTDGSRKDLCSAFNFGPYGTSNRTVESLVEEVLGHWEGEWNYNPEDAMHEAFLLNLSIDKANQMLNWRPIWNFEKTIEMTIQWYQKAHESNKNIPHITEQQIDMYSKDYLEQLNF